MNKLVPIQKILVMEDDSSLMETIVELLTFKNFKTYHTQLGYEGIQIAKKELPNIIICSRVFIDLNCWDIFQALQKEEKTKQIPFIFLSSRPLGEYHEKLKMNSSAPIVIKPFFSDQLMNKINDCLVNSTMRLMM